MELLVKILLAIVDLLPVHPGSKDDLIEKINALNESDESACSL